MYMFIIYQVFVFKARLKLFGSPCISTSTKTPTFIYTLKPVARKQSLTGYERTAIILIFLTSNI